MKRCILIALLAALVSGCFSPTVKVRADKPLVDIDYGDSGKKDKDGD